MNLPANGKDSIVILLEKHMNKLLELKNKLKAIWSHLFYVKRKTATGQKLYRFLIPYYRFVQWYPVWFFAANRKNKKLYNEQSKELDDLGHRIIGDLKRSGIAICNLLELFPKDNSFEKLRAYANSLTESVKKRDSGKTFLADLWPKRPVLDFKNPFLGFILDRKIVNIVNAYMGMCSRFFMFTLSVALPVGQAAPQGSQNWHRDPEDRKLCKVFLYLNDVDENSGPFIYVKETHHHGKFGKIFPQKPPKGYSPIKSGVRLENFIPEENIVTVAGRAGTVVFCDTAGFHRGGYALSGERLMFTGGFYSAASFWPVNFSYPENFGNIIQDLDPVVRYALAKE